MNPFLSQIYLWTDRFSRVASASMIALLVILHFFGYQIPLSVQVAIALISLLIGIPHGAIDHLIAVPQNPKSRFYLFIAIYVLVAVAAGWVIASWNTCGFIAIVVMSSLHFGFGDASFANEWCDARGMPRYSRIVEIMYALPAGLLPVVLPLTDVRATKALKRIHPSLSDWAGSNIGLLRDLVFALTIAALAVLVVTHSWQLLIDLALLLVLAILAPPLITFALYFGCWHATRHTARLVPKLAGADELARVGSPGAAIWAAIYPGLYAVVGVLIVAIGLLLMRPAQFGSSLLWSALVIVWALTVPHMAITSRFDLRALSPTRFL